MSRLKTRSIYIHTCIIEKKKLRKNQRASNTFVVFFCFVSTEPLWMVWFKSYFLGYFILDYALFQVGQTVFVLVITQQGFIFVCWVESVQYRCVFDILIVCYTLSLFFIVLWLWIITVSTTLKYIHFGTSLLTFLLHTFKCIILQWTSLFYYY